MITKITPLDLIKIYKRFDLNGARFYEEKGFYYFERNDCIANPYGGDSFKFDYYSVSINKGFIAFEDKDGPGQIYSKGITEEQKKEFVLSGDSINVNPRIQYFVDRALFSIGDGSKNKNYSILRETGEIKHLPQFDGCEMYNKSHSLVVFRIFSVDRNMTFKVYNPVLKVVLPKGQETITGVLLNDTSADITGFATSYNRKTYTVDISLALIKDYDK